MSAVERAAEVLVCDYCLSRPAVGETDDQDGICEECAEPVMSIDAVTEVLVAHQRRDCSGCLCGWSVLGASHAVHQAEALAAAGLLRDDDDGTQAWHGDEA